MLEVSFLFFLMGGFLSPFGDNGGVFVRTYKFRWIVVPPLVYYSLSVNSEFGV